MKVRFRFLKTASIRKGKPSASPGSSSRLECWIAPVSAIAGFHWENPEAQTQYSDKLKASEEEDGSARSFRVHLSSGNSSCFLFLDPSLNTFELHSEMHRAFASALKEPNDKFLLDLRKLDRANQTRALHAFFFLATTVDWEPICFGHRSKKNREAKTVEIEVRCGLPEASAKKTADRAILLGEANNEVRTLANLPANELNPKNYRERVRELARKQKLDFEFWDRKELIRRKAGAFLAVVRSDPQTEAGIVCLRYTPKRRKKTTKTLSLVGKGICFDTGGYNLKAGNSMLGMHGDMTGSALAFALCGYFAAIEADFEVRAYLALAENLISPTAYKPNEVVIASDGTSIEVVDTDAEGRMVLADTLAFARASKPDLLIDYATLTGAAIRSLDTRKSVVFSHDEKLASLAVRCGNASGERVWSFPMDSDYRKNLKSKIADILQCSESSNADHIYAATFLGHFAGKQIPWIHMDLSGCENKDGLGLIGSSTTGFGVLWTDAFVREVLG